MVYEKNLKVIFARKSRVLPATCLSLYQSSNSSGIKNSVVALEGEYDIYNEVVIFQVEILWKCTSTLKNRDLCSGGKWMES